MGNLKETFTKKVAGAPVWVWALLLAVVLIFAAKHFKGSGKSSAASSATPDTGSSGALLPADSGVGGGGSSSLPNTTPDSTSDAPPWWWGGTGVQGSDVLSPGHDSAPIPTLDNIPNSVLAPKTDQGSGGQPPSASAKPAPSTALPGTAGSTVIPSPKVVQNLSPATAAPQAPPMYAINVVPALAAKETGITSFAVPVTQAKPIPGASIVPAKAPTVSKVTPAPIKNAYNNPKVKANIH